MLSSEEKKLNNAAKTEPRAKTWQTCAQTTKGQTRRCLNDKVPDLTRVKEKKAIDGQI